MHVHGSLGKFATSLMDSKLLVLAKMVNGINGLTKSA
jgi:hypothetical protein